MHIMILSCKKATELIEKKLSFGLNFRERIQLSIHKSMCEACSEYENQSLIIEKGIENMHHDHEFDDLDKFKQQILEKTKQ